MNVELISPPRSSEQVLSAASDGTDVISCRLTASLGTSMSTPIVAGAAAMVRASPLHRIYALGFKYQGLTLRIPL